MTATELHVQAGFWLNRRSRFAALFMEGEAVDRSANGRLRTDALYAVVRARGLPMTTEVDHLSLRPIPGWSILCDDRGALTLRWPYRCPLLLEAPVALPNGWTEAAEETGIALLFVGCGLGLHEHAGGGQAHAAARIRAAAEDGALAAAAVLVTGTADREALSA